jgi:hypothetical protein
VVEKTDLWEKFRLLRNKINDRQELARVPHDQIRGKSPWAASETPSALSFLEVIFVIFIFKHKNKIYLIPNLECSTTAQAHSLLHRRTFNHRPTTSAVQHCGK